MRYESTKTYGHELGLSCCFRQHKADSHCNQLHGYALSFKFTFGANELDGRNWVQDFGGLKALKDSLVRLFDHKLVVAEDDPMLDHLEKLAAVGLAQLTILPTVGCESFAKIAFDMAQSLLWGRQMISGQRVSVLSCECSEHGANSAIYKGD